MCPAAMPIVIFDDGDIMHFVAIAFSALHATEAMFAWSGEYLKRSDACRLDWISEIKPQLSNLTNRLHPFASRLSLLEDLKPRAFTAPV